MKYMKKLERIGSKKQWVDIFQEMDKKDLKISDEEIQKE
jgi:hypothetical protein